MTEKMKLKPVRSATLQDSVYQELFQAIVSSRLKPGERIVLETVAKQLEVSIMPVREAIRKLEAGNLVTVQNRRIIVNELSLKNVKDILKVRLVLECYAAAEAAKVRCQKTVRRLEELFEEMERTDDIEAYLKANREFHNTIYRECDNPILQEVIDSLWERYSPYLHILLDNRINWKHPDIAQRHEGMLKAMREQDPKAIRRWVEMDLSEAAEWILEMMAQQGKESSAE